MTSALKFLWPPRKTRPPAAQRGGTLLGIILGALVGLGAALAVAVYVTKVPVPFMNKSQPRNPDGDAAEAQKNKDWNPNAALAGKSAQTKPPADAASAAVAGASAPGPAGALEATVLLPPASPASAAQDNAAVAAAVIAKANAAAAAAAKKASAAAAADPLGDLAVAKARPAAPADPAPPSALPPITGSDPFNYFIQAGAFRTVEDAEQQRARLLLLGVQAKVTEREQSGRTVYRVRLGPFDKKEDADRAKERLDSNSIETALVRVQR